jgi:hypothetical protein
MSRDCLCCALALLCLEELLRHGYFWVERQFVEMVVVIVSQHCSQIGEAQSLSLGPCWLWAVKSACFVGLPTGYSVPLCGVLEHHV